MAKLKLLGFFKSIFTRKKSNAFNWNKSKSDIDNNSKIRRSARRPVNKDWTEDYVINSELTKGLYHNQYPGFKLAAGLAYPIIATPITFMGYPIISTENKNEATDERLKDLTQKLLNNFRDIHTQSHREGTIWVYPKYDSKEMQIVLEFIDDDSIVDIVKDINTGKVIAIYTDEQLKVKTGYNQSVNVRRIRIFTESRVEVQYKGSGSLPTALKDKSMRNVAGILPVPFANNSDGQEVRGWSDYERVISNLKSYHDLSLSELDILAKFNAKMIQEVDDFDEWLGVNGFDSISDIDIQNSDLFINRFEKEKTSFEFPERATDGHGKAMKRVFKIIAESSGLPELVLGAKTEGNSNTAAEQMSTLVRFVNDKRREKNVPYKVLFSAILRLLSIVESVNYEEDLIVEWDQLEAVSDDVKAQIFKDFADGIQKVMNSTAVTKQQLYNLWKINFPAATEETFEEFVKSLWDTGRIKQWGNASLMEAAEFQGFDADGNTNLDTGNE